MIDHEVNVTTGQSKAKRFGFTRRINLLKALKMNNKGKAALVIMLFIALLASFLIKPQKVQESPPLEKIFTDEKAVEYFYSGEYDTALAEYLKLCEEDPANPLWFLKISEIYSVKGATDTSAKYLQTAKELIKKNLDSGTEISDITMKHKYADILNYIVFMEFMNKDYQSALTDGEEYLKDMSGNRSLLKTMIPVFMVNGDINKAMDLVNSYPVDSSSSYDVAEHAQMKLLMENWGEGLSELRSAWNLDKDEYKVFDVLAVTASYSKNKLLEKITALSDQSPEEAVYKLWLSKLYSMREETTDMAQKLLDEADGGVDSIEGKLIQLSIFQNSRQSEKAEEMVKQLLKDNPTDYRVLHAAGWFYLSRKQIDDALYYCKKSMEMKQDYPDNYGMLMPEILKASDKKASMESYLWTALLEEPYNYSVIRSIADYYWTMVKNNSKALEYYRYAEVVKPGDPEVKYNIALILISDRKEDEAIEVLKKASQLEATNSKYHRTLGTIYMIKGNNDEAIKEINSACLDDKEDTLALNNAGCYYITAASDLDKGVSYLAKANSLVNLIGDEEIKKSITENYNKAKKLAEDFKNGEGDEELKIPDFELFY